jgi:hypothetical protein
VVQESTGVTAKLDEENVSIDTAQAASWHDHHQQQQTPPLATRAGRLAYM